MVTATKTRKYADTFTSVTAATESLRFSYNNFKTAEKVILEHSNLLGVDREGKVGGGGGIFVQ